MKKYLGSKMGVCLAVVAPCVSVGPIILAIIILLSEISFPTIVLSLMCLCCSVLWCLYIKQIFVQLYTWGDFTEKGVYIKTLLSKRQFIYYENFSSVGIGWYNHGFSNSNVGLKQTFIFFSREIFEEKYRSRINLWKPSSKRFKISFDKRFYNHLLRVLPQKQAAMLERDYKKFMI